MAEPNPAKRKRADEEQQEESRSTPRRNFENFARFADVTFILQDEIRVCVNSAVMRTASPVFAAMLGPHFKEGHALAQARSGPVEIALPEDDGDSFGQICQVLHCQADTKFLESSPEMLLKIWVPIQKYDLKEAMELSLEYWLRQQLDLCLEPEDLWLLALFCFQFEEATAFQSVTQQLILSASLPFVKLAAMLEELTEGLVPGRVIYKLAGHLQARRNGELHWFTESLYRRLPDVFTNSNCLKAKKTQMAYFEHLENFKCLEDPDADAHIMCFLDDNSSLLDIVPVWSSIDAWAAKNTCHCTDCLNSVSRLRDMVRWKQTAKVEGLCLECFGNAPGECTEHDWLSHV